MSEQEVKLPSIDDPLYSTKTVAAIFGVKANTVRDWINTDRIKAVKFTGEWRILKSEVAKFAEREYGNGK